MLSNYLRNKLLEHFLKVASFTVPANIYIGLSTADPGRTGSGLAEPSGNGYARVQMNLWEQDADGDYVNTDAIEFPAATGSWGTITHFAIFDAVTGGNFLIPGDAFDTPFAVAAPSAPYFGAGQLHVVLD